MEVVVANNAKPHNPSCHSSQHFATASLSTMTNQADTSEETTNAAEAPAVVRQPRRNLIWLLIHAVVYLPLRFWCRTNVIGRENIAADKGGVFIVNHQSYLDPLFVAVRLTRSVSYLARDSLFKVPFIGWVVRNTYVIPISRTAFRGGSIRTALERLEQGYLVGIYPQGTRCKGQPELFKPGFLSLIRRTDAPVYPVAIVGADRAMPKGAWFIRPAKVTVVYGKPLSEAEMDEIRNSNDDKAIAESMKQKVLELYRTVEQ